jgi:tetratricopeptide (TPR) repeat protein
MRSSRLLIGATAAVCAAAVALLGGVLVEDGPAGGLRSARQAVVADTSLGFSQNDTKATVRRLEAEAASVDATAKTFGELGLAYQQRARETADPTFYSLSERALRQAAELDRNDVTAASGLASLALARHRFAEGLVLGRRALRLGPGLARNYGIVGDALVELGRYPEAFRAFDRMAALKPGIGSYARVSYARELLGDGDGALEAMRLALGPAAGRPEPTAWTRVQLGKLHWNHGQLGAAEREFRLALRAFPGYVYALDALAQVEAAKGHRAAALTLAHRAVASVPLPQFIGTLADLLSTSGKRAEARRQLGLVGVIERVLRANGVRTDLETALFDIDHGVRLHSSLALARRAHADRPSIQADDVLAWALRRNGRCGEALHWSKRSLRLGTQDALMFFHRAEIERCLGHGATARTWYARALELNPHFSLLWAPVARKAVS